MNPYYYLFYKLNHFLNKKGDNEWGPIGAVTLFVGWNIGLIYIKILPITAKNFDNGYKYGLIVIVAVLFISNAILFSSKSRITQINEKYNQESETSRKIGNVLVILYIALSLGLIVFL